MKFSHKAVLAVGVAVASSFGTMDASACLRAMESPAERPDKPDAPHLVAQAEQALDAGKLAVATNTLLKQFPTLRVALTRKDAADHLENRAMRIVALASVRSAGAFGVMGGQGDQKKKSNLDWSVGALRKLNAARPDDASLQADLGEALARTPATQKESLEILSKLATDDLIGSPHAYAALATLQAAAGDASKSADALKRCQGMTSTPAICQPAPPVQGKPATPKDAPQPPPVAQNRA